MECNGIDFVTPIDKMPPGSFPYLFNARVLQEGRIDARPGYTQAIVPTGTPDGPPNSIRRLNNPVGNSYTYVGGVGSYLYSGIESAYSPVDSFYSGDPLSLIPFKPDQSPASWMYVYDRNKSSKIDPAGNVRAIGVVPPIRAPVIDLGIPADVIITAGDDPTGWTNTGNVAGSTILASPDRTDAAALNITIGNILYNTGSTGWACIEPIGSGLTTSWMGERMKVILNATHGNQEVVVVREIHQPITTTTIADIQYDTGTTGLCSIILAGSPSGLARNSQLHIGSGMGAEGIRVLEVIPSPDGQSYSVRASTVLNHIPGEAVLGVLSWYCYTVQTHAVTEPISAPYITNTVPSTGTGGIELLVSEDASRANGRQISSADDYLHISIFLQNPQNITDINLYIDIDANTASLGAAFTGNYWKWTIPASQLVTEGVFGAGDTWTEIVIPISSGTRIGSDFTRNFSTIKAIKFELVTTGVCAFGFDYWYFFGTYGEVIQPNSPVGVVYQSRFRDSSTGAHSVPGPQTRYQLFPLREAVIVTPPLSTQVGVDTIDMYRQGGTVTSSLYVASKANVGGSFTDSLPDSAVLEVNQPPDLTAFQPWPILDLPWTGNAKIVGTSVVRISGTQYNMSLISNTVILINGQAFLTYGQPHSNGFLELTQDAGDIDSATIQIASPTLAGHPLPFAFGPLEGPFAPVVFALGDPINGANLYYSNFSDADSASDQNSVEVSTPSSDLVSGAVWNGLCFVGTRDDIFCVRYSYLTNIGASNNTSYQWARVAAPSGIWSRWACCACPIGVAYLGRDGIYIATDSTAVNISDAKLYPLFPHDGQAASSINSGSNIILPVDMTLLTKLRLSYCDEELRFSYIDTGGNFQTLIYQIYKKRWFLNNYANHINFHYLVEAAASGPNQQEILMGSLDTGTIMLAGGNTDFNADIQTVVLTPSLDGGDERTQKLYVDSMTQADGNGNLTLAAAYNNAETFSPVLNIPCTGGIVQTLQNIASLANLALYRNIGAKFAWTGGPAGPRLYAWEMSGFIQPYLSLHFVTQFGQFSFPGWKHLRRMFPALISNGPVMITVKTQDGRVYGPYTIASSGGQYRIFPQMLDQNIKDLAFAVELDGGGLPFAFFPADFTAEVKEWSEETYIKLAIFKA